MFICVFDLCAGMMSSIRACALSLSLVRHDRLCLSVPCELCVFDLAAVLYFCCSTNLVLVEIVWCLCFGAILSVCDWSFQFYVFVSIF